MHVHRFTYTEFLFCFCFDFFFLRDFLLFMKDDVAALQALPPPLPLRVGYTIQWALMMVFFIGMVDSSHPLRMKNRTEVPVF